MAQDRGKFPLTPALAERQSREAPSLHQSVEDILALNKMFAPSASKEELPTPPHPPLFRQTNPMTQQLQNVLMALQRQHPAFGQNINTISNIPTDPRVIRAVTSGMVNNPNSTNLLGSYNTNTGDVYVNPNAQQWGDEDYNPFSILAHEATHALVPNLNKTNVGSEIGELRAKAMGLEAGMLPWSATQAPPPMAKGKGVPPAPPSPLQGLIKRLLPAP